MPPNPPILIFICALVVSAACSSQTTSPTPSSPPLAEELIFYDWLDDSIETVFDDFTEEYGVKITYLAFDSTEEAVENMRSGQLYNVVVMENQFIPALAAEGLLAEIDYANVPKFKNIPANFRDLTHDPGNRYAIPSSWGTTGLVVRSDLVEEPITKWADMWDSRYAGKIVNWSTTPRFTLGAALKTLGYSANSENPVELEEALGLLLDLKQDSLWFDEERPTASMLIDGDIVIAMGWSEDVWLAQEGSDQISYVLPEAGMILWGNNFVIPANSPNKNTAELFLDFVLRAEVTGQIVNVNFYPMPKDAATDFNAPEILNDSVVYPTNEEMKNAELLLPLSPEGERLYARIWDRLLAAIQ